MDDLNPSQVASAGLLTVPIAQRTWDFPALLTRTAPTTGRIRMPFGRPVEIVGMYPSVIQASAVGGLLIPSAEDILVLLDIDRGDRFTNSEDRIQGGALGQYCTLAALSSDNALRRHHIRLNYAAPTIQAEFRWRRDPTGGPWYEDADIRLSLFVRFLTGTEVGG